jgi:hypothetical protein
MPSLSKNSFVVLGNSVVMREPGAMSAAERIGDRDHHLHDAGAGLGVGQLGDLDHVGARLGHPVVSGDAEIEVAVLDERGDLLRAQDLHARHARVGDGRVVLPARLLDLEVGLGEEEQGLLLEAAFGQCE